MQDLMAGTQPEVTGACSAYLRLQCFPAFMSCKQSYFFPFQHWVPCCKRAKTCSILMLSACAALWPGEPI